MGIRVECPNGHRLHLKAFLAGRRGLCPQCGAKFTIPDDDRPSTSTASSSPASWYVQLGSGARHGPISDIAIRQWLSDGRIDPDARVWQPGWSDWRTVTVVFADEMLAGATAAPVSPAGPVPIAAILPPAVGNAPPEPAQSSLVEVEQNPSVAIDTQDAPGVGSRTGTRRSPHKPGRRRPRRTALVVLFGMALVLLPLVVFIVLRQ